MRALFLSFVLGIATLGLTAMSPSHADARPYRGGWYRGYPAYRGYRGWYGLETERRLDSVEDDPLEEIRASIEFLRARLPSPAKASKVRA